MWQGFDQLAMSVDAVDYEPDEREIIVSTTFVNQSDETLQIHVLDTGLRLTGRSITAGTERYSQLFLAPGEEVHLQTFQRVHGQDAATLGDEISTGNETWNITGRVKVSVSDLSEPIWLPFRYDVETS